MQLRNLVYLTLWGKKIQLDDDDDDDEDETIMI